MMNSKIIPLPDDAIVELSKEIYMDGVRPAIKEVGDIGGAIMKFVALPFKFLGMTADELEKKYANFLENTINKVPMEECVIPKGVVAAPLLDHVKYVFDENGLAEMFSNLLANAMSANVEKMVHPAFVEMLKQMSPLDVEFMHLYFRKCDLVEISELTWERGETQKSLTYDSLARLGIINSVSYDDRDDVAIMLTDFGKVFRDLCMLEPSEINTDELGEDNNVQAKEEEFNPIEIGYMFQDSFGTARKSITNGRVYVRQTFQMQDVKNGSDIIILLKINNVGDESKQIDSLYIECGERNIAADNVLPTRIAPGKYMNFIFSATPENKLLDSVIREQTKYVFRSGELMYELPITSHTKKEVEIFLRYGAGGDGDV